MPEHCPRNKKCIAENFVCKHLTQYDSDGIYDYCRCTLLNIQNLYFPCKEVTEEYTSQKEKNIV